MRTRVRISIVATVALLTMVAAPSAGAQVERSEDKPAPALGSVPIERLLATVAKRANKKFIVDPRVHGEVSMVGQEPTSVDYPTLLLILRVQGFAAVEE